MVLFKRKPVRIPPPREIKDQDAEVWYIAQTGEVFATYEEYLTRMDFYSQRRFICQITGQSKLTFLEALKSELAGAAEVEQAFPEALKGPVLRRVQFQTISRIDALVDMIYDEFKSEYFPGESVTFHTYNSEKMQGTVRGKTRFGAKVLPDGTFSQPFSRYFVTIDDNPEQEHFVDETHISRDRKSFTKAILRSFIKKTVTREAWNGAPWLVKHDLASVYKIDQRIPPHLMHANKLLERKQLQAQKRALHPSDPNDKSLTEPARLPELKPATKSQKGKQQAEPGQQGKGKQNGPVGGPKQGKVQKFPIQLRVAPTKAPTPPPPPPPPKYPIEDLQLEPRPGVIRPRLKFMCMDAPAGAEAAHPIGQGIQMKAVGQLLETWDTLNVYCEIFKLDSFTFDDFVEAMCVTSEQVPTQLLEEIHCGVLKILVGSEADGGKVQITLPELEADTEDEEEDDEEDEDGEEEAATPEPEPKPAARATRSSLAKLEAERLAAEAAEKEKENQVEPEVIHQAEAALVGYDWVENLRKREFKDGGWEMILVGLLHQLSKDEQHAEACENLLAQLVPPHAEPTQETVRLQYANLDVNHRAEILQIICMLTTETKAVRGYMEDCSEQMTAYRKDKIEWQRQRKQALEELKVLHDQRKILLPDNMPPSPPISEKAEDVKVTDGEESQPDLHVEAEAEDDSDEDAHSRRGLRRARDRAAERQRRREEEERRKEKAEAAKVPKQSKQFLKLLKDIERKEALVKKCEDEIAVIDNDLREADCPRTRVLGRDRFWNRYYWFERNGMPYGGLPDSSTASAGYANGCIWVQGPDELEREGYIDMPPEFQNEYKAKFNMTVPERKKLEEGATSVYNAYQWGFFSDPEDVDGLLNWLDPRGFNEMKLRKEIVTYKDKIVKNMENRKAYLTPQDKEEKKEEGKRMSTRTRTQHTPELPNFRCLNWQNTMALEEQGHLHSEPPPPPRLRKQARKRSAVVEEEPSPPRKTRRR